MKYHLHAVGATTVEEVEKALNRFGGCIVENCGYWGFMVELPFNLNMPTDDTDFEDIDRWEVQVNGVFLSIHMGDQ